jgi:hypothetical protein
MYTFTVQQMLYFLFIGHLSCKVLKQNLTGYIQYYKNMVGQTKPQFLSDLVSDRKKKVFANSVNRN